MIFYLEKNLQQTSYIEDQGFLTMIWIQRPADAIQCSMCHSPVGPMYCEVCVRNVKKHIYLIYMQVHKVVSFKQYWRYLNYPNCRKRPTKQYELWYEQCGIHICTKSNSSGKHLGHKNLIFSKSLKVKSSC